MIPIIRPTPKQHQAWQALKDNTCKVHCGRCADCFNCEDCKFLSFIFFGGGAGGGKSWFGCELTLTNCYFYPESRWFIGREERTTLMRSTFVTWNKVCKFHKIPPEDWKLNGQYNYIEFINGPAKGSRVDLLDLKYLPSDPEYDRYGSSEYTGGWIEEGQEVDFGAFDVLKSRVGRHLNQQYKLSPKLLTTLNPTKGWPYRVVYKPWREGTLPADYGFIQSLYRDNPHTAGQYGRQLDSLKSKVKRLRLKDGKWEYEDGEGALVEYDSILDMFTNAVEDSKDKFMTVDVARFGDDKTVIYCWRGFEVYKIYIYEKQGTEQTEEKIKQIAKDEQIPFSHICIDQDGIGGGVVDHLGGVKGFTANSSPLEIKDAQNKEKDKPKPNYANLKSQCSYMLADKINNHGIAIRTNIFTEVEGVDNQSFKDDLTEEIEQIKEKDPDKDKKLQIIPKDEVKTLIGRSPDYSDTLMMRMYFELKKPVGEVPTTVQGGAKPFYNELGF